MESVLWLEASTFRALPLKKHSMWQLDYEWEGVLASHMGKRECVPDEAQRCLEANWETDMGPERRTTNPSFHGI